MKARRSLKSLLMFSLYALFIDRCAPIICAETLPYIYLPKKQEEIKIQEFSRAKDLNALEYLVLAHSKSFNTISHDNNCKGYAIETFRTYKKLIAKDKRQELEGKVRIAFGNVTLDKESYMHVWTEISLNNEWKPYETTDYAEKIENNEYLKFETINREFTNHEMTDYFPIMTLQANQKIARLNLKWLSKPGELKCLIYTLPLILNEDYNQLKTDLKHKYNVIKEKFLSSKKKTEK